MLKCYSSNKIETLKILMFKFIGKQPIKNPFQSEIILVRNNIIKQWIEVELALQYGIVANIKFFEPINFIYYICNIILPNFSNKKKFLNSY